VKCKEEGAFPVAVDDYMHYKRADSQTIATVADALGYFTALHQSADVGVSCHLAVAEAEPCVTRIPQREEQCLP